MAYAPQEEHSRQKAQSALGHGVGLGLMYSRNGEEVLSSYSDTANERRGTRKSWRGGRT